MSSERDINGHPNSNAYYSPTPGQRMHNRTWEMSLQPDNRQMCAGDRPNNWRLGHSEQVPIANKKGNIAKGVTPHVSSGYEATTRRLPATLPRTQFKPMTPERQGLEQLRRQINFSDADEEIRDDIFISSTSDMDVSFANSSQNFDAGDSERSGASNLRSGPRFDLHRQELQSSLLDMKNKKEKIDDLLMQLQFLRATNVEENPKNNECERGSERGSSTSSTRKINFGLQASASAYQTEGDATEVLQQMNTADKVRKLAEVRTKLDQLQKLVEYFHSRDNEFAAVLSEVDNTVGYSSVRKLPKNLKQPEQHQRYQKSGQLLQNKKQDNPSREKNQSRSFDNQQSQRDEVSGEHTNISRQNVMDHPRREPPMNLSHADDEDAVSQSSSNLALRGACGVDLAVKEKERKLKAAQVQLHDIQELIKQWETSGLSPSIADSLAALNVDVESDGIDDFNITQESSGLSEGEVARSQKKYVSFDAQLQKQRVELERMLQQLDKLNPVMPDIKRNEMQEAEERRNINAVGAPCDCTEPTSNQQFTPSQEVWNEMRRRVIIREELRQKKRELEAIMNKDKQKKLYSVNQDNQSDNVSFSNKSEQMGTSMRSADMTMATWGSTIEENDNYNQNESDIENQDEVNIDGDDSNTYTIESDYQRQNAGGEQAADVQNMPRKTNVAEKRGMCNNVMTRPRNLSNISSSSSAFNNSRVQNRTRQENIRPPEELIDHQPNVSTPQRDDEACASGLDILGQVATLQKQLDSTQTLYQSLVQDSRALHYLLTSSTPGQPISPGLVASLNDCYQQLQHQQANLHNLRAGIQKSLEQCYSQLTSPRSNLPEMYVYNNVPSTGGRRTAPTRLTPQPSPAVNQILRPASVPPQDSTMRIPQSLSFNDLGMWPPYWYHPFVPPPWVNPYYYPAPPVIPSNKVLSPNTNTYGYNVPNLQIPQPLAPANLDSVPNNFTNVSPASTSAGSNTMMTQATISAQNNLMAATMVSGDAQRTTQFLSEGSIHNDLQPPSIVTRHTENAERLPATQLVRNNTFTVRESVQGREREELDKNHRPVLLDIGRHDRKPEKRSVTMNDCAAQTGISSVSQSVGSRNVYRIQPVPKLNLEPVMRKKKQKPKKGDSTGGAIRREYAGGARQKIEEFADDRRPSLSSGICGTTYMELASTASAMSSQVDDDASVREQDVDSDVSSNYSLFDSMRESIYAEVAVLIAQNESRPRFLVEIFHELQMLTSDYLRQRALFEIRNIVANYLTGDSVTAEKVNQELLQQQQQEAAYGLQAEEYYLQECQGSGESTPHSIGVDYDPFASDSLGDTVIHLERTRGPIRCSGKPAAHDDTAKMERVRESDKDEKQDEGIDGFNIETTSTENSAQQSASASVSSVGDEESSSCNDECDVPPVIDKHDGNRDENKENCEDKLSESHEEQDDYQNHRDDAFAAECKIPKSADDSFSQLPTESCGQRQVSSEILDPDKEIDTSTAPVQSDAAETEWFQLNPDAVENENKAACNGQETIKEELQNRVEEEQKENSVIATLSELPENPSETLLAEDVNSIPDPDQLK